MHQMLACPARRALEAPYPQAVVQDSGALAFSFVPRSVQSKSTVASWCTLRAAELGSTHRLFWLPGMVAHGTCQILLMMPSWQSKLDY
jgi:hypothetical protein